MFIKVPIKCVCTTVMLLCRNDHPVQCSCNFARLHLYYHRCCIILIAICCPGNVFCAVWLFFYFSCVLLWSTFIILDRYSSVFILLSDLKPLPLQMGGSASPALYQRRWRHHLVRSPLVIIQSSLPFKCQIRLLPMPDNLMIVINFYV